MSIDPSRLPLGFITLLLRATCSSLNFCKPELKGKGFVMLNIHKSFEMITENTTELLIYSLKNKVVYKGFFE